MESLILKKQIEAYEEQAMSEKPNDLPKGMEELASKQSEMLKSTSGMMRACIEKIIDEDNSFLQLVELPHKSYKRLMRHFWRKMMPYAAKTPGMNSNLYTGMVYGEGSIYDFLAPIVKEYYSLDDKAEVEKELEKEIKAEKSRKEAAEKRAKEEARRKEMNDKADKIALEAFIEQHGKEPTDEEKNDYKGTYSKARQKAMEKLLEEESARKKEEAKERAKLKRAEEKAKEEALMAELAAIEDEDERQIRINSIADERFFTTVKGAADMEEDEQNEKTEKIREKIEKAVAKILKGSKKTSKKKETSVKEEAPSNKLVAHQLAKEIIYAQGDKYPMLSDKDRAIAEIEPDVLRRFDEGQTAEEIKKSYISIVEADTSEETSEVTAATETSSDELETSSALDNIVEFKKPEEMNSSDDEIRAALEKADHQMSIFDFI